MTVPEAAMHKTDRSKPRKHHVGAARERAIMKTVPEAPRMHRTAKVQFGLGVLAADSGHHSRPDRSINNVGHELACVAMKDRDCMRISQRDVAAINKDGAFVGRSGRIEFIRQGKVHGDRLGNCSLLPARALQLAARCSRVRGNQLGKLLARCRPAVDRP